MANPEHLSLLRQGSEVWNAWRKQFPDVQPDLQGADLREMDLALVNLSQTNLNGADLSFADLSFADLSQSDLSYAILSKADLSGSLLRDAILYRALVVEVDLCGANLRQAVLCEANLSLADLSGSDLREASLQGAILEQTDFQQANVQGAMFGEQLSLTAIDRQQLKTELTRRGAQFKSPTADTIFASPPPPTPVQLPEIVEDWQPDLNSDTEESEIDRTFIIEEPDDNTFLVAEGMTESLFNHELFISVRSVRENSATCVIGALKQPILEVEFQYLGDRITYLNTFEIYLLSTNDLGASFVIDRVHPASPEWNK